MKVTRMITVPKGQAKAVRVAFATATGAHVDEHFGWARRFEIYDVTQGGFAKAGRIEFDGEELDERGSDDKLTVKIESLDGCDLVYSTAIGGPAAARLTRRRMQPMVARDVTAIDLLLARLIETLRGPTPPWLRKLTRSDDPERFKSFDDDE